MCLSKLIRGAEELTKNANSRRGYLRGGDSNALGQILCHLCAAANGCGVVMAAARPGRGAPISR